MSQSNELYLRLARNSRRPTADGESTDMAWMGIVLIAAIMILLLAVQM